VERERIKETLLACPGQGVHDLRTRHAGDRTFVELHLEVEGHLSVEEGHAICDLGEAAIKQLFRRPSKSQPIWNRRY